MFINEEQSHIMASSETKLDDTIGSAELSISNCHEIIRKDRTRYGDGVAYIFTTQFLINFKVISLFSEAFPVEIEISNGKSISLLTWYRDEAPVEIFDHVELL